MQLDADVIADVIVIGGGISGLASAWWLQQSGVRVVLLDAAPRAGGTIGSAREDGFLVESGPNSVLDTTPLIGRLLDDLNIGSERVYAHPAARNRYVLREGRLLALPVSPAAFLSTPLFSTAAKLRLLCEPFIGRAAPDAEESVADFVRRRLGAEFLDYAIDPFVAGVYAGDAATLGIAAAFPRLHALERDYGSLALGQVFGARNRARGQSRASGRSFAFRQGMQTLTDAIAARLARIELSTGAVRVTPGTGGLTVTAIGERGPREFRARSVLLATSAYAGADLVAPFAPQAAAALAAIPYAPVAVAVSGYRRGTIAHALDGFGFLVPRRERRQILGTLFSSTLFDDRAPPGLVLLTTFVGGMRQPELAGLDESAIAGLVEAELTALLGATAPPEFMRIRYWPRAIPQYTLGHADRMSRVETAERDHPGLFFCCNYRGGVSVGDCIESAHRSAGRIGEFLRGA